MPTDPILSLELDFMLEGRTHEELDIELRRWVNDFAPDLVSARILQDHGPAGGASVVLLTGTATCLWSAAAVWAGGDEDTASEVMSDAR